MGNKYKRKEPRKPVIIEGSPEYRIVKILSHIYKGTLTPEQVGHDGFTRYETVKQYREGDYIVFEQKLRPPRVYEKS